MKSTLLTMTASLCGLALLVGAALAGVNILTEKPIAEAQAEAPAPRRERRRVRREEPKAEAAEEAAPAAEEAAE